uniref:RING-type domain-containing protein n=1 Tax=Vannella robusta TaxID=1487602 RepID=A0A7S4MLU9_9EUKA
MFRSLRMPNEHTPSCSTMNSYRREYEGDEFEDSQVRKSSRRVSSPVTSARGSSRDVYESNKQESLQCPYCSEDNLTSSHLFYHLLKVHSKDQKRVGCPVCVNSPEKFPCTNLLRHLRFNHQIQRMPSQKRESRSSYIVTSALSREWRKSCKSSDNMWKYLAMRDIEQEDTRVFCEACRRSTDGIKICILSCDHVLHEQCPKERRSYYPESIGIDAPRCPACSPPKKRRKKRNL